MTDLISLKEILLHSDPIARLCLLREYLKRTPEDSKSYRRAHTALVYLESMFEIQAEEAEKIRKRDAAIRFSSAKRRIAETMRKKVEVK